MYAKAADEADPALASRVIGRLTYQPCRTLARCGRRRLTHHFCMFPPAVMLVLKTFRFGLRSLVIGAGTNAIV